MTYDRHDGRRTREVRHVTHAMKRVTKQERHARQQLFPDDGARRLPVVRAECERGARPCPLVSCKWNLYLDVTRNGSITMNFPDMDPEEMPPCGSCALDIADDGPHTLQEVGDIMNLTRERVRQVEQLACDRATTIATAWGLSDFRFAYPTSGFDTNEGDGE